MPLVQYIPCSEFCFRLCWLRCQSSPPLLFLLCLWWCTLDLFTVQCPADTHSPPSTGCFCWHAYHCLFLQFVSLHLGYCPFTVDDVFPLGRLHAPPGWSSITQTLVEHNWLARQERSQKLLSYPHHNPFYSSRQRENISKRVMNEWNIR